MIKKRKWLYFVFGILMLMVMPGFEDNKIQAQTSVGELLIAENKLEGGVTERIYVITNDEISENTRSVSARKATKKYTYEVNGEDCLIIYVYANFSYGHSDGRARISSSSYSISKIDSHIEVSNISQQNYAGTDPKTVLSFTLKDKHYTPILVLAKKITLSCKNNGDYY